MAGKGIAELKRATSVTDTDLFITETAEGTRSIEYAKLKEPLQEEIEQAKTDMSADTDSKIDNAVSNVKEEITKENLGLDKVDNTADVEKNVASAEKLGNSTVGSNTKPIYLDQGTPTESNANVGSATRPVYLKDGTLTECDEISNNNDEYALKSIYGDDTVSMSRKEGTNIGKNSFAFGMNVEASGDYSFTIGAASNATGAVSYAEGNVTKATGDYSHAEGGATEASGSHSHAEGSFTVASGYGSHAEGSKTIASNKYSHAEGVETKAIGQGSHAEGYQTEVQQQYGHAEGFQTKSISGSHAEGSLTIADGGHSEGSHTKTTGLYSHSEGAYTTATDIAAHAGGCGTLANNFAGYAIGVYNKEMKVSSSGAIISNLSDAFVIGNGGSNQVLNDRDLVGSFSNAFRVTYMGQVYGLSAFNSSGADYAEFIKPWYDNNPDNEDRVGYFVTIKNGLLYKANDGDYIAGITSGNPSIVGNADEDYYWRYERDEFNRFIMEDVPEIILKTDEEGKPVLTENFEPIMIETGNIVKNARLKLVDNYDASQQNDYVERKDRPEWDYVGMLGVLPVRDDGTCVAGQFCKCGENGIATLASEQGFNTYMVIERISDNIVSVILK